MCYICFNEWHKSGAATYWEYHRSAHDSIPPWLEEARHSDIRMTGNGSRPREDGQLVIAVYNHRGVDHFKKPWQGELTTPPRHVRWARRRRIPYAEAGPDTTQETLSSID